MPVPSRLLPAALLAAALVPAAILMALPGLRASAAQVSESADLPSEPGYLGVTAATDTAVFAGGCFWGVEAVFEHLAGVTAAVSGYAGGSVESPTYEQVGSGRTGHAESVLVVYDPARISYGQLLQVFFAVAHDPTQRDRQGPDVGTQYRSAVFYRNDVQREATERYIATLERTGMYREPIATEVTALDTFHPAEAYHQDYMAHHPNQPYIVINDAPKLVELRRRFPGLYREPS